MDSYIAQKPQELDFNYGSQGSGDPPLNTGSESTYQHGSHPEFERETSSGSDGVDEDIPISRATKIFAMCAALNSCNLGYDIGVNTSARKLLQDENSLALTDVQTEMFMGSLNLFAAGGALAASAISDKYGRRGGFIAAALAFVIGVLCMSYAQSYGTLMFGRIFVGLGVGFGLSVDPIYISEISPPKYRGYLVTWSEIATNVGILLGFSSGLIFDNVEADAAWRLMFGMGTILPVVLTILVICVMPESPRWLVKEGQESKAKEVLSKVYPAGYDVSKVVDEIQDAIIREEEAESAVGWEVILSPSPAFRRMLIVGIGSAVAQQVVGIDAIQYFLTNIMEKAGIEDRTTQSIILIILGFLKLSVIVVAGKLFDTRGRRPLMFASLIGMTLALFMVSITLLVGGDNGAGVIIVALGIYLGFFSLGMGPGAWLIPSEVFSTTIRAKAMSVATFMNRIVATTFTSTFLSAANFVSWPAFFALLGIMCLLIFGFFYKYLPETKGKSLEDMSVYFAEITGDTAILEAEKKVKERQTTRRPHGETGSSGIMA